MPPDWGPWLDEWDEIISAVPQSALPASSSGSWKIEKFEIDEERSLALYAKDIRNHCTYPKVWNPPGIYTRLISSAPTSWFGGGEIMNDKFFELRQIANFMAVAHGHVVECGLGLGLFVTAALRQPRIESITVLEIEPDVISLVGPLFADESRVRIIQSDFLSWPKDRTYDWAWVDTIADQDKLVDRSLAHHVSFYEMT